MARTGSEVAMFEGSHVIGRWSSIAPLFQLRTRDSANVLVIGGQHGLGQ